MIKLLTGLILVTLSTTSFAATTGSLLLQGIITQKVSVAITPSTVASALDLSTTQSDLNVGSVNIKSNSNTGYKLTITSANLGKLKRTIGSEVFGYTMKYGAASVGLSSTAGTTFTNASGSIVNINTALSISYTGVPSESMVEGTYNDTVTLNVAAN
jgi:hypothetical protein